MTAQFGTKDQGRRQQGLNRPGIAGRHFRLRYVATTDCWIIAGQR
jgi:hypothetical protein